MPPKDQAAQFPLRALELELRRIPVAATSPQLAAMRLQWWRRAIDQVQAIVEDESLAHDPSALPPAHAVVHAVAHLAYERKHVMDFELLSGLFEANVSLDAPHFLS